MFDSSIDRSVTLPEIPVMDNRALYDFLAEFRRAVQAAYDNLAERINLFLYLQDWQYRTHPALTSSQNNFDLSDGVVHRFSNVGAQTITGFLAPGVAAFVILLNEGPSLLTIANNSASSAADNRIRNTAGTDLSLSGGQTAAYWYDVDQTVKKWRQISL